MLSSKRDRLKERWGITPEQYAEMVSSQGGGCAICGGKNAFVNSKRDLCVDHDHATGNIRGLLCHSCNIGLGQFREKPALLEKAIAYLKKFNPEEF